MILAIDPGNVESAYVVLNEKLRPIEFQKLPNGEVFRVIQYFSDCLNGNFAIEMIASYGMAVGKEVFETTYWIGRFWQEAERMNYSKKQFIYRKDEKINLCHSMKAKDTNIRQALIDRFGPVGTKKKPGWFYGVSKDVWSAIAVGVTYHDMYLKEVEK